MAVSPDFVAHVLDLMADLGGVSARRMFSGQGLFRQGRMFALIIQDVLYLKTDDRNRPRFSAAGMKPFVVRRAGGKSQATSYWEAPPELLDNPDAMIEWSRLALAAAAAKAARTPQKRKQRTD